MTAYATDTFSGDGSTVEFTITFDYIQRDHVTVSRVVKATQLATVLTVIPSGTPTGDQYVWETDKKIKVGTAPATTDELKIERDTPEDQQLVQWKDGSYIIAADLNTSDLQWLYGLQELEDKFGTLSTSAIKYFGAIDLTTDAPPALPEGGTFYINTGSGLVLPAWTGIGGDSVVGSEQVIYNGNTSEWEIFKVPSSQAGVLQVNATDPITVDNSDPQRPDIGIKKSSATQDGSMSKEDKDKLDNLPDKATGINLGYTKAADKGTVTNTAGDDATIPFATAADAGLFIEAATPGSGTVQYARQVTNAGAASWAQVAIPPGTIINDTEPTSPPNGQLWFRPSNSTLWIWDNGNSTWQPAMEPVPTGGGENYKDGVSPEKGFFENVQEITEDYTITAGSNAFSAGPITIKAGKTVTIGAGETWTVVGGGDGILWQRNGTSISPENAGDTVTVGDIPANGDGVTLYPGGNLVVRKDASSGSAIELFSGGSANANRTFIVNTDGSVAIGGHDAAHTMQEYETGTWQPSIRNDGSTTYNSRVGEYTKIGDICIATAAVFINNADTSMTASIGIVLPFASKDEERAISAIQIYGPNTAAKISNLIGILFKDDNFLSLYFNNGQALNAIGMEDMGDGVRIAATISYRIT